MSDVHLLQTVFVLGAKAAPDDDVRVMTQHFKGHVAGGADVGIDMNDEDRMRNVEDAMDAWWAAIRASHSDYVRLAQYRWYEVGDTSEEGHPVIRVTEKDVAGASPFALPPQVASSVTLATAARSRWGRFYIPSPATSAITSQGRFQGAYATLLANATKTMYDDLWDASGFFNPLGDVKPVIVERASLTDGLPGITTRDVLAIRVDDIPDIIRSRRFRQFLSRTVVELSR